MRRLIVTKKSQVMTRRMKNVLNEATTVTIISHRYELTRPKPTAVTIISHRHEMKSERLD